MFGTINRTASFDSRLNRIVDIPEENLPASLQPSSPGRKVNNYVKKLFIIMTQSTDDFLTFPIISAKCLGIHRCAI